MVGRPKKRSGFRVSLNNDSKNFIFNVTENEDFTLQSTNTILNSSRIVIRFHPTDRDWQVAQCRFFGIDHVSFLDIVPSLEASYVQDIKSDSRRWTLFFHVKKVLLFLELRVIMMLFGFSTPDYA